VEGVDGAEDTEPARPPQDRSSQDRSAEDGPPEDGPPEDPESWTDDQWISWLEATDDPDAPTEHGAGHPRHWSRGRSASMLGAAMLGLHEVIYGPHGNEIAIVVDAGGEPPGDDLPEVHLDPEHPERSEVIVRRDKAEPRPDTADHSESP
jgi:hypothetical protein